MESPFHTKLEGVIAIGASAGGTEAIATVIKKLPSDMPPILIVQHMPPVFSTAYAERLDKESNLCVFEASDRDTVERGNVLLAPGDSQMRLARDHGGKLIVRCDDKRKYGGHCPSVDVLFESVALVLGQNAIGVILTGMGADGAQGLLKMRNKGAFTIGQNKETSLIYSMPKIAFEIGAVIQQAPIDEIPGLVLAIALAKFHNMD